MYGGRPLAGARLRVGLAQERAVERARTAGDRGACGHRCRRARCRGFTRRSARRAEARPRRRRAQEGEGQVLPGRLRAGVRGRLGVSLHVQRRSLQPDVQGRLRVPGRVQRRRVPTALRGGRRLQAEVQRRRVRADVRSWLDVRSEVLWGRLRLGSGGPAGGRSVSRPDRVAARPASVRAGAEGPCPSRSAENPGPSPPGERAHRCRTAR